MGLMVEMGMEEGRMGVRVTWWQNWQTVVESSMSLVTSTAGGFFTFPPFVLLDILASSHLKRHSPIINV